MLFLKKKLLTNKSGFKPLIPIVPLLFLLSCNSADETEIKRVDTKERLTDTQLLKIQKQEEEKHKNHQLQGKLHQHNVFYFGFDLRASPQEDAAQYIPFLKYLESVTGYMFKLHFTPKSSSTTKELGLDKTQFAAMGATSFLEAQDKYGAISLVRGLNHQNKAEYQSVFVVRPNSSIQNIEDIKGRKLAFGSRTSTQGHLIPRIVLSKKNILLRDLKQYTYTGSHQNCAEAVVSGKYEVCGMQDQLAEKLVSQGQLKIIHRSNYYPSSGIVANKNLPVDVRKNITKALLEFEPQGKHSAKLYNWNNTEMPNGFSVTRTNDYSELRKWSIKLGFFKNNRSTSLK